jgi:hypothetical protein
MFTIFRDSKVKQLLDRVDTLERTVVGLDGDLDELHARFKRWIGRESQVESRDRKRNGVSIDPVNDAILARRASIVPKLPTE